MKGCTTWFKTSFICVTTHCFRPPKEYLRWHNKLPVPIIFSITANITFLLGDGFLHFLSQYCTAILFWDASVLCIIKPSSLELANHGFVVRYFFTVFNVCWVSGVQLNVVLFSERPCKSLVIYPKSFAIRHINSWLHGCGHFWIAFTFCESLATPS